jgi:ferredoxin--NADP+ reductase
MRMDRLEAGDCLADVSGPLGKPSALTGVRRACVVGGGAGCAIAWPTVKHLKQLDAHVESIVGFRSKDLIILENAFKTSSDELYLMTDDGSAGEKGLVTDMLKRRIEAGANYDRVIAIGPLIMMKFVSKLTAQYGIQTIVSMNPVMIDGTGMCGCCRLSVGGETKFACVDGPEFDAELIDFDEAMKRGAFYREHEDLSRERECNLLKEVI